MNDRLRIIELTDGTKWVHLEDFRRECDEARQVIRVLAEHGESEIQRITKERDKAQEALQEIANASHFDNIGNWARNKARKALEEAK